MIETKVEVDSDVVLTNGELKPETTKKKIRDHWINVLNRWKVDYSVFREYKPLEIGIHQSMKDINLIANSTHYRALTRHVGSSLYLKALTAGGCRYHLDGTPGSLISDLHIKMAQEILFKESSKRSKNCTVLTKKGLVMHAKTINVSFVITDFEKHLHVDSVGKKVVGVEFETPTGNMKASINSKSFRKAQAAYQEHEGNVKVVVSGHLDISNYLIDSASLVAQPIKKEVSSIVPTL